MEISYKNIKLKKTLSDERLLLKHYGKYANNIKDRMSILSAARNLALVSHLPPIRRHKLSGYPPNCFAVDISKNYRLVFTSKSVELIDPKNITEIIIIKIEDYH